MWPCGVCEYKNDLKMKNECLKFLPVHLLLKQLLVVTIINRYMQLCAFVLRNFICKFAFISETFYKAFPR